MRIDAFAHVLPPRYRERVLSNLQRRAKAFGYVLQAAALQPPQASGVS